MLSILHYCDQSSAQVLFSSGNCDYRYTQTKECWAQVLFSSGNCDYRYTQTKECCSEGSFHQAIVIIVTHKQKNAELRFSFHQAIVIIITHKQKNAAVKWRVVLYPSLLIQADKDKCPPITKLILFCQFPWKSSIHVIVVLMPQFLLP